MKESGKDMKIIKKIKKPKMKPLPPRIPSDKPIMCCFGFKENDNIPPINSIV